MNYPEKRIQLRDGTYRKAICMRRVLDEAPEGTA